MWFTGNVLEQGIPYSAIFDTGKSNVVIVVKVAVECGRHLLWIFFVTKLVQTDTAIFTERERETYSICASNDPLLFDEYFICLFLFLEGCVFRIP